MTFRERYQHLVRQPPRAFRGEEFVEQPRVVRTTRFPRTYGGRLYVSDRRVHYAPDIFNRLVGAKRWNAKWNQIRSVEVSDQLRAPTGQQIFEISFVTTRGETETFTCLAKNEHLVEVLNRWRSN